MIHIGEIIKGKVRERNMSIAEFAEKICCDRTTVYDLFKRSSIDVERLLRISSVLEFNFIKEIYLAKDEKEMETENSAETTFYLAIPISKEELEKMDLPKGFLVLKK